MRGGLAARGLAAALLLAPAWGGAAAQTATSDDTVAEARVDATQIGEGDSLTLTIEVRGTRPGRVEEPDLSGLADFNVAAGPSTSTSTSMLWSGGKAASRTSQQFSYILLPRRRGTLTIPTISVRAGVRTLRTDPISVEVVAGRMRRSAPRQVPGRGGAPGIDRRGAAGRAPGDVLVEVQADKTEAFVGEQVLLTYKVYTQVELVELPSPKQLPAYTGFWVEELPNDPRASIHRVTRGGEDFVELTLMKKALFATVSGDLVIEETAFELPVRAESRDPFDSIFFTPTRLVERSTRPLTIRVKPLPAAGRPASFTGAVGRYSIAARVDRSEARVNEALGLHLEVKGSGNIRVVGEPVLPPLPDYKRYEPKVEEKREVAEDRLQGSKSWDYVLTPLAPGRQDLPPIRFAYFDPERSRYVETSTQPIEVAVLRGEGGPGSVAAGPAARREVVAFGRDVRFIKPASALSQPRTPFHRSGTFLGLLAAPLLANAALLFAVRRRERIAADAGEARRRRAPGFARRRLRRARRMLGPGSSREFCQEVARALTGYLSDKLGVPPSGLTHDRIDALLADRGAPEDMRAAVRGSLERCDEARFAPVQPGPGEMRRMLEEAEHLLAELERRAFTRAAPGERA
ncbi:MAG TPA: BatD family protein [Candidatus Polarisedimenticolia bacterium]|nr:BatD family protein [Candidatus Polarisedimenticolia bacterium]